MKISKELSSALLLANFYCTILVVSIHYNSLYHYDQPEPTDIFYLIQTYINTSLTRIAVPFFALISGFFLFLNFEATFKSYKNSVTRRLHTLLAPYLIVAIIVFSFNTLVDYTKGIQIDYSINSIINTIITPETIQLWYIRDLLFLVAFSPIIFFLCKKLAYLYIPVITAMWFFDYQPFIKFGDWHLITIEALYFFSLGCLLSFRKELIDEYIGKKKHSEFYVILALYLLLTLSRVYLLLTTNSEEYVFKHVLGTLLHKLSILIGIFLIVIISKSFQFKFTMQLTGLTFFVYLYHLLPLSKFILLFWNNFTAEKYLFFVTTPSAIILTFGAAYILKKEMPGFYKILTGGR